MRYILLVFFIVAGKAFGQSYYKDIITDRVTVNYVDHKVDATITPVKGKISVAPQSFYYWYRANKINVTQGGYSGKLLNGPYVEFYENKNLKEKGNFKNGLKSKEWNSWSENGLLKEKINWTNGRENGRFYRYDAKGNPKESGRYKNGLLNGKLVSYISADSSSIADYKKGELIKKKKRNLMPRFIKRALNKSIFKKQPMK